jgi:CHRD domain-containing protein
VTDYHIHTGNANQSGSVFIGFGVQGGDTLNATTFIGSRTGLSSANMTAVLNNPAGFYLNLHNGEFSGGAVRGQVPEPALAGIVGCGMGLVLRRRGRVQ